MSLQKGRDLLLKVGDGGAPEVFTTIGAARTAAVNLNNQPVDGTTVGSGGIQELVADAGVQSLKISLDGFFKDSAAEELLRAAAFARTAKNYDLIFPNGDSYRASFVVENYARSAAADGLEAFSVALARSGPGTFTPGA